MSLCSSSPSLRPWVLNLLEASIDQSDVLRAASLLEKKTKRKVLRRRLRRRADVCKIHSRAEPSRIAERLAKFQGAACVGVSVCLLV